MSSSLVSLNLMVSQDPKIDQLQNNIMNPEMWDLSYNLNIWIYKLIRLMNFWVTK